MLRRFWLIAWLVLVSVCRGQEDAAVYTVPADGTPLIIDGRLEEGDAKLDDGTFYDTYTIQAPPGTLMAQLNSAAFDPHLFLYEIDEQGELVRLGENDDGPAEEEFGTNSFVELEFKEDQPLLIAVGSVEVGSGSYRVALAKRPNGNRSELFARLVQATESGIVAMQSYEPQEAKSHFFTALSISRGMFPGDHGLAVAILSTAAVLCEMEDEPSKAEPLYEEALAIYRRLLQTDGIEDHSDVARSLNDLASVRQALGRVRDAEPLYEESLAMYRRLFQVDGLGDHLAVAQSLNNLASVRDALGRPAEAEPLYEEALAMYRRLYQAESIGCNPDVAHVLNNLASVRQALGQADAAEPLCEEALEIYRRLFQSNGVGDHADVAMSLNNLASIRQDLGRAEDAEPLYQQALEMFQRLFPGDHPDVALGMNNLANVRLTLGRAGEAEPLFQQALDMYQRLFPGDHPDVASSLNNLAGVWEALGRAGEAEPLYQQALDMRQRLFPGDHPDVATSLNNLAFVRNALGRAGEAEPLCEVALAMYRRVFQTEGVGDHPDVAMSLNNLASVRQNLGRADEAAQLYEEALAMYRRVFQTEGVGDHPDLAHVLNNLASVRQDLGRAIEAEPLLRDSLKMHRRLFQTDGIGDHPAVAAVLNNLASVLLELGRAAEAEPLLRDSLKMHRRLFQTDGVGDHPAVAAVLNNLASVRQDLGRFAEAELLYDEALSMHRRLFQPNGIGDHPDVLVSLQNLALLVTLAEPQRAEPLLTEALSMADRLRLFTRGDAESRALMAEQVALPQIAHWLGRVRLTLGQPESAFSALETGRARSLMDLFELQFQGGLDAVIAKLPDEQRLRVEQARATEDARRAETTEAEAVLAASTNRTDLTDEDREQLRQDAIAARTALGDAVAATNTALGRAIPATRAQDPAELRAALLPGELVVAFGWDGNDAYLLTLDRRGADGAILFDGMDDREARVASLRTDLETFAGSLRTPGVEHDPAVALSLAHALIPERLRSQVSNADRLIVVTTGPLGRVPMDLILSALNERAGIVQAHSALQYIERRDEALRRTMTRRRARTIEADAAVVLGRPQYAGSAPELPTYELAQASAADYISRSRSASRSLDAYRLMQANLTDLPGTQTEAMVISASLDAAGLAEGERRITLLGPDASIPRLMAEVERLRPRVLHIATHGIIGSAEDPLDVALALTPGPDDYGFLTLDDLIRQWPGLLDDTDLVVLSACDTGWGATKGDAEFGLPWGFFLSGATSVVASLWQVDDASTALLMARFHEGRLGSFDQPRTIRGRTFQPGTRMTTLDALDEAKLWLRTLTHAQAAEALNHHAANLPKDLRGSPVQHNPNAPAASDHPYEHPYYWAPFVLLGSSE